MLIERNDDGAFVLLICDRHTSPSEEEVEGLDFLHVYDTMTKTTHDGKEYSKVATVWVMRPHGAQLLVESG